ncbi:MAG: right-handed parallel beta-helix repeat-containing protein [bacterium]
MKGILVGFAAVLMVQMPARGAVLHVPEEYLTVLKAVDVAVAGDSVLVGPGIWNATEARTVLVFGTLQTVQSAMYLKPGVTVIGVAGAATTVLDGGQPTLYPVCTIEDGLPGAVAAHVVGLTVTGGGSGVAVSESPLELVDCQITGNHDYGVLASKAAVTLTRCVVSNNQLSGAGDGGVDGHDIDLTCTGCTFAQNILGLRVETVEHLPMTVVLRDCVFRDHSLRGAVVTDVASVDIERCTFLRNCVAGGTNGLGGGLWLFRCSGNLRFCTFAYDSAGSGGGAAASLSYVHVESNTFFGCHAGILAAALCVDGTDVGTNHNIFASSTGRRGAVSGLIRNPQTGCNLFWNNVDGDYYEHWLPPPTDIHADPLFCDPVALDFHLQDASPAAPAHSGGCGLIGAFDVNCGPVSAGGSLESRSWGSLKSLYR